MALDQLQTFIAVAEREHVTRAATALGLTPPAVSAAVASLEREFGTKLFHRVGRGLVVTEGGELLLDEARDLVNRAEASVRHRDEAFRQRRPRRFLYAGVELVAKAWLTKDDQQAVEQLL